MTKRSIFTSVTPLPSAISRDVAVATLHNHAEMITLNPLVIQHEPTTPAPQAPLDEHHCSWYQLTDRISYLPGIKGQVTYKACFHDLPRGLQTHVYAPAGLEIKGKWSICGNEAGEEREVRELGLVGVPRDGLYLREDVDMRCNVLMTGFVKKALKKSHALLAERLAERAQREEDRRYRGTLISPRIRQLSAGTGPAKGGLATTPTTSSKYSTPGQPLSPADFVTPVEHRHEMPAEEAAAEMLTPDIERSGLFIGMGATTPPRHDSPDHAYTTDASSHSPTTARTTSSPSPSSTSSLSSTSDDASHSPTTKFQDSLQQVQSYHPPAPSPQIQIPIPPRSPLRLSLLPAHTLLSINRIIPEIDEKGYQPRAFAAELPAEDVTPIDAFDGSETLQQRRRQSRKDSSVWPLQPTPPLAQGERGGAGVSGVVKHAPAAGAQGAVRYELE